MLETLITSKTRFKLLLRFFLNSITTSCLRNLATDFGGSTNAIRFELTTLSRPDCCNRAHRATKKLFQANTRHPLCSDIKI